MTDFRVQDQAGHRLDEIYTYTRERWGDTQAEAYIRGLFDRFRAIAGRQFPWRPIPAAFGVHGYVCRHEHHFIYWRELSDGAVGIVTVLHKRMHQMNRFREDFSG
ncbi:type II toxin-antitoxin system RelE/ParE family toxin [Nguyenibacter vanlangensis]|uniref:Type II toxin-antitoxin system RelE/ParE family toxin n=1 Tax=Nguyenibacter vanlangensis TaxID=1216886 RepID=A0A7Y7IV54_9PROT|nr:type II toxin-antitoxin system RelE/ParE family toxin [Nguyenibacter vanlangensis]NVN10722.1 type II toxin-antitoxin system RelE/ParE family toxin [Nguyenibacter vanlangensis]